MPLKIIQKKKKKKSDSVKKEIKEMYYNLLYNTNYKFQTRLNYLMRQLDNNKSNYFRTLFLLSLFCSYYFYIKNNIKDINTFNLTAIKECYKSNNFYILDMDNSKEKIVRDLIHYFNTDATNIMPITGKLLYDLHQIELQIQ